MLAMELVSEHFDKIIGVAGSIAAFFIGRYVERLKLKNSSDTANYQALIERMPKFEQIKIFFNERDLKNSFKDDIVGEALDTLREFYQDKSKHFHNKKLNIKMIEAWKAIDDFAWEVANRTSPDPNGRQTISRQKFGHGHDDFESGELLNDKANVFFFKYEAFLATAKKELLI